MLQALAELLTTNKLSELACLTLYLMYEKKNGKQSVWYEFIKVIYLAPQDVDILACSLIEQCNPPIHRSLLHESGLSLLRW
jgi:hypothetical protein